MQLYKSFGLLSLRLELVDSVSNARENTSSVTLYVDIYIGNNSWASWDVIQIEKYE